MKIYDMPQGESEWFEVRRGKITASNFASATAGGQGKTRKSLMLKLLAERMTGLVNQNGYTSASMEWGNEYEDRAAACYELETGLEIDKVGFWELNENIGCSPDRLVGRIKNTALGLVQIKCPDSHTHIDYILSGKEPATYKKQIQGEMWVTGAEWSDFVSYDPRNISRDFFKVRVERDDKFIKELSNGINLFVEEMLELEEKLK